MRDEYVLHGVTTNPAIFGEAFASDEYDEQIAALALEGHDARSIYQEIATQDVRDACDVLRPVYDATGGADGFVSLEVDPDLARDKRPHAGAGHRVPRARRSPEPHDQDPRDP